MRSLGSKRLKSLSPDVIPKAWDDEGLGRLEVPLAYAKASARHIPADYYYRIPIRRIYRSYPLYSPGHEPAGYIEWLKNWEPELLWDYDSTGRPLHSPALRTRELDQGGRNRLRCRYRVG
jgi:hypothetical protein